MITINAYVGSSWWGQYKRFGVRRIGKDWGAMDGRMGTMASIPSLWQP